MESPSAEVDADEMAMFAIRYFILLRDSGIGKSYNRKIKVTGG
jgi:hypothetical protein